MTCTHHYILETPTGPTTSGRCKLCGHERHDFRSWYDEDTGETWKQQAKARKGREISLPSRKRGDTYLAVPQNAEESRALLEQEREWAQRAAESSPRREKAQTPTRVPRNPKTPRYMACVDCGVEKVGAEQGSPRCWACAVAVVDAQRRRPA